MPFPLKAVANEFIALAQASGIPLSPMKLQKLVYYTYGWHLAIKGEPLIDSKIQAWEYGPVIPQLYSEFKRYGNGNILGPARDVVWDQGEFYLRPPRLSDCSDSEATSFARELIAKIWSLYKGYSASRLSNATHQPGTPWAQVYTPGLRNTEIPDEVIRKYFVELGRRNGRREDSDNASC